MKNLLVIFSLFPVAACGMSESSDSSLAANVGSVDVTLKPGGGARVSGNDLPMPAALYASATLDACDNSDGPYITLAGEVSLGGLGSRLTFQNNKVGTHTHEEDIVTDVVLIPAGESITFAKQPSRGGVGGNPWIYVQFIDAAGNALSDETLLGRCVQGMSPSALAAAFSIPSDATVDVTSGGCSNSGGPNITLTGALVLTGIGARVIFRNNVDGTHEYTDETSIEIPILDAGESLHFAKSPAQGGAGGNPLIYFQFIAGEGDSLSEKAFLGRCNQLSP